MLPYSRFDVRTGTTRPVLPTDYVHRRKWVEALEQFLTLVTNEEITNINQQIESTAKLFVSNVISRVIAQLVGQTDFGFATIRGTTDGALYVIQAGDLSKTKIYGTEVINIATAADHTIISGSAGTQIKVVSILFTVQGEVDITLKSGSTAKSGPMDFGGDSEPTGIVACHGPGPFVCDTAEDFVINLSAAVQVSGYCTYYKE